MTIVTPQKAFFVTSARIVFINSWSVLINSTGQLLSVFSLRDPLSVFSSRVFPDRDAPSGGYRCPSDPCHQPGPGRCPVIGSRLGAYRGTESRWLPRRFSISGLHMYLPSTTLSRAAGGHHEEDPRNGPQFRNPSWLCGWSRISPATPPSTHWPPILAAARSLWLALSAWRGPGCADSL
jgi:hypothetical protein